MWTFLSRAVSWEGKSPDEPRMRTTALFQKKTFPVVASVIARQRRHNTDDEITGFRRVLPPRGSSGDSPSLKNECPSSLSRSQNLLM